MLFFDIETAPNHSLIDLIELDSIDPPANYKDPEKIQRWIADKKAVAVNKMALDFDLAKVRSITYSLNDKYVMLVNRDEFDTETQSDMKSFCFEYGVEIHFLDEEDVLKDFFHVLNEVLEDEEFVVGYNILNFDFKMLRRRLLDYDLGICAPIRQFRDYDGEIKYSYNARKPVIDLYQVLGGKFSDVKSLKFYARKWKFATPFIMENYSGQDSLGLDGAEFVKYALADIYYVQQLFDKLSTFIG